MRNRLYRFIAFSILIAVLQIQFCPLHFNARASNYSIKGTWMDPANWEEPKWSTGEEIFSPASSYQIENARQFAWIMNYLYANKHNNMSVSIYLTGGDIDLSGKEWFPGGYDKDININGVIRFQGNNRIINGLTIGGPEKPVRMKNIGLFPTAPSKSSTSKYAPASAVLFSSCGNLGITNAAVYGDSPESAGIFAGKGDMSFGACFATGTIHISGDGYVGGLVGITSRGVSDCYTDCTIVCDDAIAGGLVGQLSAANSSINSCYTNGTVTGKNAGAFAGHLLARIIDLSVESLNNCYYNQENNASLPSICKVNTTERFDMTEQERIKAAGMPPLEERVMGKTLSYMQSDEFVRDLYKKSYLYIGWAKAGGNEQTKPKTCFVKDAYDTNNGLPVLINANQTPLDTYKKYADVSLPESDEVSDTIAIKISPPTKVYYTLDGTKATVKSLPYTGPITIRKPTELNILAVRVGCEPYYETKSYTFTPAFSDTVSHWAKEYIAYVVKKGLFAGTSAELFSPDVPMTRAMFATALGRLAGIDPASYATEVFDDVRGGDWFYGYVAWAYTNGIMPGTDKTRFSPMSPISREEIAVILVNFGNYLKIDIPAGTAGEMPFGDGNLISPEALPSVIIMNQAGILTGRPGNLFDPKGYTTRGEIAVIFKRFITVFF